MTDVIPSGSEGSVWVWVARRMTFNHSSGRALSNICHSSSVSAPRATELDRLNSILVYTSGIRNREEL